MGKATVFVVSDDPAIRDSLSELVSSAGLCAKTFPSLGSWLGAERPDRPSCLVLDAHARDFSCPACLTKFASACASLPVLLLVDRGDVPVAVRAIKDGAFDVLEKPHRDENLLESIERATAAGRGTRAGR